MTDIRTRLADALAAELEIRRGTVQTWGAHIADVLLSLPGIAIVELPELDNHWAKYRAVEVAENLKVVARRSDVLVEDEECLISYRLRVARALAAAILAAANAAEAAQ